MTKASRALGILGEDLVCKWYLKRGYTLLARNWSCRDGEIDLILKKDDVVVFCEVKTRSSEAFGLPAEAVTMRKQMKLRRLAARWLQESSHTHHRENRFDVACVMSAKPEDIDVIEGAF